MSNTKIPSPSARSVIRRGANAPLIVVLDRRMNRGRARREVLLHLLAMRVHVDGHVGRDASRPLERDVEQRSVANGTESLRQLLGEWAETMPYARGEHDSFHQASVARAPPGPPRPSLGPDRRVV